MYKIAICEDDANYIQYLKKVILSVGLFDSQELSFFEFSSGEILLENFGNNFDVVFLDIQMEGLDGYETAQKLRERDKKVLLVFCSGVRMPDTESFKVMPYRYLLKQFSDEKMFFEIKEIMQEVIRRKSIPSILCKYRGKQDKVKVYADSILWIEYRKRGSNVYICGSLQEELERDMLICEKSINELMEIFTEKDGFTRLHISYAVNMGYINRFSMNTVQLVNGVELNVARAKRTTFRKTFSDYMSTKYKEEIIC